MGTKEIGTIRVGFIGLTPKEGRTVTGQKRKVEEDKWRVL